MVLLGMIWWHRLQARRAARDAVLRAARIASAHAAFGAGPDLVWEPQDLTELARAVRNFERIMAST